MISFSHAVCSLRPGVEWVMTDNDVENIVWHTTGVGLLTMTEVEAEIARLELETTAREELDKQAKLDVITHAKSLGFTDEMILVMYPHLIPPS